MSPSEPPQGLAYPRSTDVRHPKYPFPHQMPCSLRSFSCLEPRRTSKGSAFSWAEGLPCAPTPHSYKTPTHHSTDTQKGFYLPVGGGGQDPNQISRIPCRRLTPRTPLSSRLSFPPLWLGQHQQQELQTLGRQTRPQPHQQAHWPTCQYLWESGR